VHSAAEALNVLRDLSETPTVSTLALAFQAANHELALVGGPVRDAFLGRGINDLDFTTSARPEQILALVEPIAEAVWDIGRDFGTIGAQILGERVEITTYRSDAYDGASVWRVARRRPPQARFHGQRHGRPAPAAFAD
jgi:poly(A) polymerase